MSLLLFVFLGGDVEDFRSIKLSSFNVGDIEGKSTLSFLVLSVNAPGVK